MFKNTLESLGRIYQQEPPAERMQRMLPAAVSGALVATAYTLTFFFVNVYTFPGLPLAIDWPRLLGMWIALSVALALFGAIAAWFTEEYAGAISGGLIFTVLLGIAFLFSSGAQNSTVTVLAVIMALTLVGINVLGAWVLRWAAHRYLEIKDDEKPDRRRKLMTRHMLTIILIGLIPGILTRMDLPAERTLRLLNELLQAAPNDPSVWPRLPLKQVPALQDHFGVSYKFYVRQSSLSAGALDVTIRFSDGYTLSCFLPVGNETNFITQCNEGEKVEAGP